LERSRRIGKTKSVESKSGRRGACLHFIEGDDREIILRLKQKPGKICCSIGRRSAYPSAGGPALRLIR